MKRLLTVAGILLALITSCKMEENPLLTESPLPYGAPQFDKIKNKHYVTAFEQGIAEAKAEIDAIVANPEAPTFENTVEAMEFGGRTLDRVAGIFYNIYEAASDEELQAIAEEIAPKMTEFGMYVSLNQELFARVKAVYEQRDSLNLDPDQLRILEKSYKGFVNGGANLSPEDKETFSKLAEKLSLLSLQFSKNVLAATNAYTLNVTDSTRLAGMPQFVLDLGAATAAEKGQKGWTFDLSYPSYGPFMRYCPDSELRHQMATAYGSRAFGGEFDNSQVCKDIAATRLEMARLLGHNTFADGQVEDRMVGSAAHVHSFLAELMEPSLPAARAEVAEVLKYARENGYEGDEFESWDFSYWAEKYKDAAYSVSDSQLKPYFQLENCIDAVFGLATRLYGLQFNERKDIPVYHEDVKVFDVCDASGRHMALFYCDFFPRESKRGGAWMTDFRSQCIIDGKEPRPLVSIVTNFSKPTPGTPSLLTHDELTTFLHEFGHSLHSILSEGRYASICGTSVDHDFVELPSQIMENWAFEPEYLQSFAKHYETGEPIPSELIDKIVAAKNYLAAYYQVRQLHFGIVDMAWNDVSENISCSVKELEDAALGSCNVLKTNPETSISTAFSHIFSGGYAAGYYSYKWAEVLAADAYSLFKEKGIFNTEVSESFRREVLSRGSSAPEAELYRNFRGHDPETRALLESLGITPVK